METVILVIHLMIAVALIGVVLLQKSEGGALGMGGGGMSGFMTGRSTANLLTRTTAILAGCFMATSITLVVMAGRGHEVRPIIDIPAADRSLPQTPGSSVPASQAPAPAAPVAPVKPEPSAPVAK